MVEASYEAHVDTDRDGLFAAGESVLDALRAREGFRIERGRDALRADAPPFASDLWLRLSNADGTYNPDTGLLARGMAMRVRATHDGTTYPLGFALLDRPSYLPELSVQAVDLPGLGRLQTLAGKRVSTEVVEDERTDQLLHRLFDVAGWPKNLTSYLDGLAGLAGGWDLAATSGVEADTSANGNDATVTAGAGTRGAAAIEDGGTLSLDLDGADTMAEVTDDAALQDLWDGGGAAAGLLDPDSDGEGDAGVVLSKGWELRTVDESAGFVRLEFEMPFDTTAGIWQTARDVAVGSRLFWMLVYDAAAVANNPTLYTFDLDSETWAARTVGAGLTETSTPVGTRVTDAGTDLVIGNLGDQSATFDGRLSVVRVYDATRTAAEAQGAAWRALDAPRHFDVGRTTLPLWWCDGDDAFAKMRRLLNAEGATAAIFEDASGAAVFKNRWAPGLDLRSSTVQATLRGTGTEPLYSEPFSYDDGLEGVINEVRINRHRREAGGTTDVWTFGETIELGPGETRTFLARRADPVTAAIVPVANTDYTVAAGAVSSVTLERTSGGTIPIVIVAGPNGATVTGLKLRAQVLAVAASTTVVSRVDTAASQAEHGLRSAQLDVDPEIDQRTAQSLCDALAGFRQTPRPSLTLTLKATGHTDRLTEVLTREIHDRVRVIETSYAIDVEAMVHRLRHQVGEGGAEHETTYWLEEGIDAEFGLWDEGLWDSALWAF